MVDDTVILAVGSAPGTSPRAIIRASGRDIFSLLNLHLDHPASDHRTSSVTRIRLRFREFPAEIPALLLTFHAPHSYTGEHSAEIQLPGNPMLLDRVIDALINSGTNRSIAVRRAHPGEFTARAFLNGKLSLSQAEGVAATIAAQSDAELAAARLLAAGRLARVVTDLSDRLAAVLALVEAGIDFTDQDDVIAIAPSDLHSRLCGLIGDIESILEHSIGLEQLQAIPWVVLTGPTNAGKSTLFNALLSRERAVVSPIAGTTRDVLAEPLSIDTSHGRAEVMLVDLAGFDESDSLMNCQMQAAARAAINRAELILYCLPINERLIDSFAPPLPSRDVVVRTKMDLPPSPLGKGTRSEGGTDSHCVQVSAITGAGLPHLKHLVAQRLADRAVSLAADTLALRPRHVAALRESSSHLQAAIALVDPVQPRLHNPELIAAAMRAALDALGTIHGRITPDDILARIFASFCIGK